MLQRTMIGQGHPAKRFKANDKISPDKYQDFDIV
jgi:hypothetical protein